MRTEFLEKRISNLLCRLSPPRAIAKNAELQRQEAVLLTSAVNKMMPTSGYQEWWEAFEERLLSALETRAWPTLREIKKARPAIGDAKPDFTESDDLNRAIDFYNKHKKACPWQNSPKITSELIRMGVLEDIRYARWRGFELSEEDRKAARKMRTSRDEWRRHCEVLAGINMVSFAEGQAREIAEISRSQLPQHLAQEAAE